MRISLSCGNYGYTTDGGNNWYLNSIEPTNIWNYGTAIRQDTIFNAGAEGVIHNTSTGDIETWWKFFNRRDIDISEDCLVSASIGQIGVNFSRHI